MISIIWGLAGLHIKKHLGFAALRKTISERLLQIEDWRQAGKVDYALHDCAIGAFAMMLFPVPIAA